MMWTWVTCKRNQKIILTLALLSVSIIFAAGHHRRRLHRIDHGQYAWTSKLQFLSEQHEAWWGWIQEELEQDIAIGH